MSWEILYRDKLISKCKCGKGKVIIEQYTEGDDWNRTRTNIDSEIIDCKDCKQNYHIEHEYKYYNCRPWDGEGKVDIVFLVPNGLTLDIKTDKEVLPFESSAKFDINAVGRFSKNTLINAVEDMTISKYSTRLKDKNSHILVDMYYRNFKSRKLSNVIIALKECIDKYDEYEWNLSKVNEFRKKENSVLKERKKLYQEAKKKSFKLNFREQ